MSKPLSKTRQKQIKDWLKAHKHQAEKVEAGKYETEAEAWEAVLKLHGLNSERAGTP